MPVRPAQSPEAPAKGITLTPPTEGSRTQKRKANLSSHRASSPKH